MSTLTDNEALLLVGQILAGFLKEYLPSEERWSRFVGPALAANAPKVEVPLDELDLSALLQVFLGNRDYLRSRNVFRTTLPFNCAFCVRNMRNSRAHQTYATSVSDDERLFDLNLLRRFTLLIDNQATEPGLINDFLARLDATIVEISKHCFGEGLNADRSAYKEPYLEAKPAPTEEVDETSDLIGKALDRMMQRFDHIGDQIEDLKSLLRDDRSSVELKHKVAIGEFHHPLAMAETIPPIVDHLNSIDVKIDRLLGLAQAEPIEIATEAIPVEPQQETELLSGLEAKAALRTLRAQLAIQHPNTDPTHALLRQSMVDLLLANRIDNISKFEAVVPEIMKRDTDPAQRAHLPSVFSIVKRLR